MDAPCTCMTVRKANRALFRFYEEAFADCPVSITQFSILRTLVRQGPTPLSDLADALIMERTSLYRTIKPLIEMKAVSVKAAPAGKAKIVSATARGKSLIAKSKPQWDKAQAAVIGVLGESRWRDLSQTLLSIPALLAEGQAE